jgi:hypothetical protein
LSRSSRVRYAPSRVSARIARSIGTASSDPYTVPLLPLRVTAMEIVPLERDALRGAVILESNCEAAVLVGAHDEAVAMLRQRLSTRSILARAWLRMDSWFDPLRQDPDLHSCSPPGDDAVVQRETAKRARGARGQAVPRKTAATVVRGVVERWCRHRACD